MKHNDPDLSNALKLGKRCLDSLEANDFTEPPTKVKFLQAGGGRKKSVPEVRKAMYDWFIDIRSSLKARLPKSMFKVQCKVFYEQWLSQQEKEVPEEKKIVFSNWWIRGWMQEYNASLRKPNKRFQIKQADREERIFEYLKNIWTVRKFFIDNFGLDPPIINGDQMPLHRSKSASQRTLNFTRLDTYVKENYSLAREKVTVYTQVANDSLIKLLPEFVFKGKGTRTKVNAPKNMHYQWASKGSYRLE